MNVIAEPNCKPIKIWTTDIEDSALTQLKNLSTLPFIHPHGIVAMPDVHFGIGATIGSVIATERAIIPAAVGVDIGCGMCAVQLSIKSSDLPSNLDSIRHAIERETLKDHLNDNRRRKTTTECVALLAPLEEILQEGNILKRGSYARFMEKAACQLSTLGGGNHFIEICLDENQYVWVMLHSGSRGIGNILGNYFINLAKEDMEKYFINLPDKDLGYFPEDSNHFKEYLRAVKWAQNYAYYNRKFMLEDVISIIKKHIPIEFSLTTEAINCHHNYVEMENHFGGNLWVTRKGAIRARKEDLGIIPGSMGQKSYIVRGKGNAESYHSCSHGAGRAMGRKEAKRRFTVLDLENQTAGVNCRKDESVLDEIPGCYKDIDVVMENQKDLVDIVYILKQILCVKG